MKLIGILLFGSMLHHEGLAQFVGIRTGFPGAYLDVRGTADLSVVSAQNYATLRLQETTAGNGFSVRMLREGSVSPWFFNTSYHSSDASQAFFSIGNQASNWLNLRGNGALGINSISSAPFRVYSPFAAAASFGGPDSARILISESNSLRGYLGNTQLEDDSRNIELGVFAGSSASLHLTTQTIPRLTIHSDGRVGIGTLQPEKNLSVAGGISIDQNNTNTGVFNRNSMLLFGRGAPWNLNLLTAEGIGSQRTAGTRQFGLDFYVGGNVLMTVLNNGRVGVGTLDPQQQLDINGVLGGGRIQFNNGYRTPRMFFRSYDRYYLSVFSSSTIVPVTLTGFDESLPVQVQVTVVPEFGISKFRYVANYSPTTNTTGNVIIRTQNGATGRPDGEYFTVNVFATQN